jgi:uncharacterized protein
MNLNYCRTAPWDDEKLEILRGEYKKIADLYVKWTKAEEKIYLSPIDTKILSHLKGEKYHIDRRLMGKNQPSIAPDGKIYTGSIHLNNPAFEIGNVFDGIDEEKQNFLYEKGGELCEPCKECAIVTRCNYAYGNMIYDGEKIIPDIAPLQCVHEQIITPIADAAAENLFKARNALFIHKHYNEMYPIMSLIEDRI